MAVHIFCLDENNFQICIQRGLVGLPEPKEKQTRDNVFDALLSRAAMIREDDYILMYIVGTKELRGVWQAEGRSFYDTSPVWPDRIYPFRCKIKYSPYNFANSLKLNDINDLRNSGKIWTWSLNRPSGTSNSMFSISDIEFEVLLNEYMKINPFSLGRNIIREPYSFHDYNIANQIHLDAARPKFESSIMTLLNDGFSSGNYKNIFGNYSDFLSYIPTNLGKEMDILLMFGNPISKKQISSYDIIEVKRDKFGEKELAQLIGYESWFLQKKVSGDLNMVRTTAIAKSFSDVVMDYVRKRSQFENKPIKLLKYSYNIQNNSLELQDA